MSDSKSRILVVGIDHVIDKLLYFYTDMSKRYGLEVTYVADDRSSISSDYVGNTNTVLGNPFLRFGVMLKEIAFGRLSHVEIYLARLADVFVAVVLCWLCRVSVVVVCRGTELREWERHRRIRRFVSRLVIRRARLVLLKELYMERVVLQHRLCAKERLLQIHNAVPAELTDRSKFDAESQTFVFLNSFRRMRNVDVLISAFSIVYEEVPSARLRLIGSTVSTHGYSPSPPEYETELNSMTHRLGLGSAITFEPFARDAWDTVTGALCFVLPAEVVWLNFSLLEAMAFGIPPIVSNTEGTERIVRHGENGMMCQVTPEALAAGMIDILRNPEGASVMSTNAKATIEAEFLVQPMSDRIYSAYVDRVWSQRWALSTNEK